MRSVQPLISLITQIAIPITHAANVQIAATVKTTATAQSQISVINFFILVLPHVAVPVKESADRDVDQGTLDSTAEHRHVHFTGDRLSRPVEHGVAGLHPDRLCSHAGRPDLLAEDFFLAWRVLGQYFEVFFLSHFRPSLVQKFIRWRHLILHRYQLIRCLYAA